MKIEIGKHWTSVQMEVAPHGDSITFDVDPGKVTIDGEHNLAELLARIEGLELRLDEVEDDDVGG